MRLIKRPWALALATVAVLLFTGVSSAQACACSPAGPGEKQVASWTLDDDSQLTVVATKRTSGRSARAVGDAWLDESDWVPDRLYAAGKYWHRRATTSGRGFRTISYRHRRHLVTLYWSRWGAG